MQKTVETFIILTKIIIVILIVILLAVYSFRIRFKQGNINILISFPEISIVIITISM